MNLDIAHVVVGTFAALVALQYLLIGLYVVPRLGAIADRRTNHFLAAQWGAMFFFVGCGLTHVGITVHTFTQDVAGYGNVLHLAIAHIMPHVLQLAGGATFIYIVHSKMDVRFAEKGWKMMQDEKDELLKRLQHVATHDPLTGLLNRGAFDEQVCRHVDFCDRYGQQGGVLYLDLDGFKAANDAFGHKIGDEILGKVAKVLTAATRRTDDVGRLGGDEFAVLLREAGPKELEGTAERIVREIGMVRAPTKVGASVGVASSVRYGQRVVDAADEAMYRAKRAGGFRYAVAGA